MGNRTILFWHLKYLILVLTFSVRSAVLSIMVPETFLEMYAAERGSGERRFIVEELAETQDKNSAFLNAMPCIASFLEKYTTRPDRATLWISEDLAEDVELQESFLRGIHTRIPLYLLEDVTPKGVQRTASTAVILVRDSYSMENTTERLLYLCGRNCDFIVILTTSFEDEETFLEEANVILQIAWSKHSLGKAVALGSVESSMLLSGSITFNPDEFCVPSTVELLDRCETNLWTRFKGFKLPSTNGCIVNLGYCNWPPYSELRNDTGKLSGVEGLMIEELMENANVGLNRVEIPWDDDSSILKNVTETRENGTRVDLVIGGLLWDPDDDVDYTTMYEETQVVWMVPLSSGVTLRGLIAPFQTYVWAVVVGVLILGVVVRIFLIPDITCLDLLALVLGVAVARQPHRSSSRIQFIFWAIYGFYLTQFYLASLAEQLIHSTSPQIDRLSELADSRYILAGTIDFDGIIMDHLAQGDKIMEKIHKKFVILESNEYLKTLADLLAGRNSTYALMVKLNVSYAKPVLPPRVHIMEEIMGTYPIAFATWRGQPYLDIINDRIQSFIEMGMTKFYSKYFAMNISMLKIDEESSDSSGELHIHQFLPAFLLMTIGFTAGFLFFILEVIFYPSKWLD